MIDVPAGLELVTMYTELNIDGLLTSDEFERFCLTFFAVRHFVRSMDDLVL